MPRDYKKRAAVKTVPKRTPPVWLWLVVGLITGAFITYLAWLKQPTLQPTRPNSVVAPTAQQPLPKPMVNRPNPAPHKPRFEFYNTLPKQEIRVPQAPEVSQDQLDDTPITVQPEHTSVRYNLQIGSYIRTVDAEKLRAELAFLGIETRIQAVVLKTTQQKRYRVMAGPYQGKQRIQQLRRQLRANGYPDVLVLTQR